MTELPGAHYGEEPFVTLVRAGGNSLVTKERARRSGRSGRRRS
jgi:hypothetical protein